jgi:hypothetical protein
MPFSLRLQWAAADNTIDRCPCREWLLSLWQWLASGRHSLEPLAASGWPLLPVLGSQLVALQPLERSAVVLPGADAWPEGLAEVLQKLGVHVLHTASFELPVETLKGQHYVHTAAGTGVAEALAAALKLGSQQQGQQQQQAQDCEAAISKLAAQERSLLRGFLLQPTWFAGAANAAPQLQLRRLAGQLPLYELANSSQQQVQVQAASAAAGAEEPVQLEPVFVGLQGSCCLAPAGTLVQADGLAHVQSCRGPL